ncbi:small multi-drug export protein [archaeon]|jgi:uncharacterized membrane protein|nr:small multi-drug export protein [archaeon]MBT3731308.1 small multi-drug export protein [archaeon]MBT4669961.1 small multi-drug export protein [archaeon]MBT5029786.1 small multi-drug export protein [archaeon]MBT5287465.1 small multi-drug export protein [archaeon]
MRDLLITIFLSLAPFTELRGGIPYGLAAGLDFSLVFIVAVLANILIIFPIFFFLDNIHKYLTNWSFYNKVFNKFLVRAKKKVEKKIGTNWEFIALLLVVAIPFPGTGAYTGCLASWAFKLKRKKSLLAISLGVIVAGIITSLVSLGLISLI